jgi:transposase
LLEQGALKWGIETNDRAFQRVQQLILQQFEVEFHVDHPGHLVRQWGFSAQRPKQISKQHNPRAVKTWRPKIGDEKNVR